MTITTILMLAAYVIALIYIGLKDHKTEDQDGFIIADRNVGIIGTISSMTASIRTGGGLIFLVGMGFSTGYGDYAMFIGSTLGFIIFSLMAPRVRKIAKERNYITMPQMIRDNIGIRSEKTMSFIIVIFSILQTAAQFYTLGHISSIVLGINSFNSIIICAILVAFYVSYSGYKSIVKTDILQFAIIAALWLTVFFFPLKMETVISFSTVYTSTTPKEFWFCIIYGVLIVMVLADLWQRIFSAKNDKVARRSISLSGFALLFVTFPMTFLGMSAIGYIPATTVSNDVFFEILKSNMFAEFIISFLILNGISVTMSTLDTQAYLFSSTLLENFLKINIKNNKKKYIYMSKIVMITMLLVAAVLALQIEDMIKYLLNIYGLILVLAPLFIAVGSGFIKEKCEKLDKLFTASILIAFAIGVYVFVQEELGSFYIRVMLSVISTTLMTISYFGVKFYKKRVASLA